MTQFAFGLFLLTLLVSSHIPAMISHCLSFYDQALTIFYIVASLRHQEGANAIAVTFKTFDGQDEWIKETLGEDFYVEKFEEALKDEAYEKNVEEVKTAIDEGKNEHDILKVFAEGADASEFGAPP